MEEEEKVSIQRATPQNKQVGSDDENNQIGKKKEPKRIVYIHTQRGLALRKVGY